MKRHAIVVALGLAILVAVVLKGPRVVQVERPAAMVAKTEAPKPAALPVTRVEIPKEMEPAPELDRAAVMKRIRRGSMAQRQEALQELDRSGDVEGIREAISVLFDATEIFGQLQAIEMIRKFNLKEEMPRIWSLVRSGESPSLRDAAAAVFGEWADASAIPGLRSLYAAGDLQGRRLAAQAMERLGDPAFLVDFIHRSAETMGDRSAERLGLRMVTVSEISRLEGPAVCQMMRAALADPEKSVRFHAASWLGENGTQEDFVTLERMRQDESTIVRKAADEALRKIRARLAE